MKTWTISAGCWEKKTQKNVQLVDLPALGGCGCPDSDNPLKWRAPRCCCQKSKSLHLPVMFSARSLIKYLTLSRSSWIKKSIPLIIVKITYPNHGHIQIRYDIGSAPPPSSKVQVSFFSITEWGQRKNRIGQYVTMIMVCQWRWKT